MSQINTAVIGTGFIGPVHVEALRRIGVNVIGLLDITPEVTQAKAAELGIPRAYASLDALTADPDVHVVHVTSPNHAHYPQAKAVLEAGKHVVCEKPLAMTAAEGAELVALADKSGLCHAVNFNLRFYPISHEARHKVQSGELGEIFVVQGSYLQDWLLYESDWNWRLEPQFSGNMRAVADIGSHWLDLTTFITGKTIASVMADFKTFHPTRRKPRGAVQTYSNAAPSDYDDIAINTEDYASVLIRYADGSRGVVTVSQVSAGRKNRLSFEIDGSKGSLAWVSENPNELWLGSRTEPNRVLIKDPSLLCPEAAAISSYPGGHNEGFPDTFKQLHRAFYAAVADGKAPEKPAYATFHDGLRMLRVADAIFLSANEDRWVHL